MAKKGVQKWPKNRSFWPLFGPLFWPIWGAINSDFGSKKVTPKSDPNPGGSQNWQKWPKKHKKKRQKTEKIVVYDIVKFQFFQKWRFLTHPKNPFFDHFFWPPENSSMHRNKFPQKWKKGGPKTDHHPGLPLGVLVQKSPFLVKIGVFGTLKWPLFDHLLDPPWIPLVHPKSPLCVFLKKWQKGVQKLVQKVTPQNMSLFGVPQKKWHPENDKDGQKPIFWPLFDHFLTTFWITLDTSCNIQRVPYMGFSKKW